MTKRPMSGTSPVFEPLPPSRSAFAYEGPWTFVHYPNIRSTNLPTYFKCKTCATHMTFKARISPCCNADVHFVLCSAMAKPLLRNARPMAIPLIGVLGSLVRAIASFEAALRTAQAPAIQQIHRWTRSLVVRTFIDTQPHRKKREQS